MNQTTKMITAERKQPSVPRAITNAFYATVHNGKRIVQYYYSGQKLLGRVEN